MVDTFPDYHAGVIITSDTCSRDEKLDTSGQYVFLQLAQRFGEVDKICVPDDKLAITSAIKSLLENPKTVLIITVGGTGLCPRDVTPEATRALYDIECSGIAIALMLNSLRYNPNAALSRLTAGITRDCLIINFPGSLKACKECFDCLQGFLKHAMEQIRFDPAAIKLTHSQIDAKFHDPRTLDGSDATLPSSGGTTSDVPPVNDLLSLHEQQEKLSSPPVANPVEIKILENKPVYTHSPYKLLDYTEALEVLNQFIHMLQLETIDQPITSIRDAQAALGCTLTEDVMNLSPIPPFLTSTMDGYLLHIPEIFQDKLDKIHSITAFLEPDLELFRLLRESNKAQRFFCCRINTGGRVPDPKLVVIPYEQTELVKSDKNLVKINKIEPGKYVRLPGSDLTTGDKIEAGTRLDPVTLALIQSMGHKSVKVLRKPCIGVMSTGDELVELAQHNPGAAEKVVDTNRVLLSTLFSTRQYQVVDVGISQDIPNEILLRLDRGLSECDILVVTGGASMGTKDYVKDVISAMGGTIHFGRVNIKPGKPVAFASVSSGGKEKFIFSLPGNPVSAYITSIAFVIPFVEQSIKNHFHESSGLSLRNIGDLVEVKVRNLLDENEIGSAHIFDGRLEFVRAKLIENEKDGSVYPVDVSSRQQSSRMLSLKDCNCLIIVDPSLKGSRFLVGQTYRALKLKS